MQHGYGLLMLPQTVTFFAESQSRSGEAAGEKVRENDAIALSAVVIAIPRGWEGRQEVLANEFAKPESRTDRKDFLLTLKEPLRL